MKKILFFSLMSPFLGKAQSTYPRVAGHVGILHPLVSFSTNGTEFNFENSYRV